MNRLAIFDCDSTLVDSGATIYAALAETFRQNRLELPPAEPLHAEGPALVELDGATCWLPPGWVGVRDGTAAGTRSSTLTVTRR